MYNKSYEVKNNALHESCFDISMSNMSDFATDYINNYPKGIFLIVNTSFKSEKVNLLNSMIKSDNNNTVFGLCMSSTDSSYKNEIKQAINMSYKKADNGQAILLCGVDSEFDIFEHIDNEYLDL